MERRGEGEGLESARKEGTERLPAAIHMDWNTGLKKKKKWDYAAVLLKPWNSDWIDFFQKGPRCKEMWAAPEYKTGTNVFAFHIRAHDVCQC